MNELENKLLLLLAAIFLISACTPNTVVDAQKILEYHETKYDDEPATGEIVNGVREIKIDAYQFQFEPKTIIVNKGEKIRLIVEAKDVPHGFEIEGLQIPGYDINTVIRPGMPLTLEFTVDEEGVWEFICTIYCGFGHGEMNGLFIVR